MWDGERVLPKKLIVEEILAKIEMNKGAGPLVKAFKAEVDSATIQSFGSEGNTVVGKVPYPNHNLLLCLQGLSDVATLKFYLGTYLPIQESLRVLDEVPNVRVTVRYPSSSDKSFHAIGAEVYTSDLDLSYFASRKILRMLENISSDYVKMDVVRRDEWVRHGS